MSDFKIIADNIILNKFIYNYIFKDNKLEEYYKKNDNDCFSINDINSILSNSKLINEYRNIIVNYKSDLMYKSDLHGVNHIIRTSIFLLIICTLENIEKDDFKILLLSALYHDIGRVNDIDDDMHGENAIKRLDFIKDDYPEEYKLICSIIEGHCIDDDKYLMIANKYRIDDIERYRRLLFILKDADSLDRVREYPYCDISYLRFNSSKKLLLYSCILFNSF